MNMYIEGIFNYCDRWCEKCAFTSRCCSFAFEKKLIEATDEKDMDKDALWKLVKNFFDDIEPTENRPDFSDLIQFEDLPEFDMETDFLEKSSRCKAKENVLFKTAQSYAHETYKWIETYADEVSRLKLNNTQTGNLSDAIEVVQRYAFFISAKLLRAIDTERIGELPVDSDENGSAKVALISISRSIAAWSIIRSFFKTDQDASARLIGQLINIRRVVEKTFPRAMDFIRPGFDTE